MSTRQEDYVARENAVVKGKENLTEEAQETSEMTKDLIREIIIPEIEREVNEGKNFALLRQIQNSAILAAWYKKNLKQTLLGKVYVDQKKTNGINSDDKEAAQKIYAQYVEAFKKGIYDLIKEDYDPATQEIILRKYFSGGIIEANEKLLRSSDSAVLAEEQLAKVKNPVSKVSWELNADSAMTGQDSQVKSKGGRRISEDGKRLRQWAEKNKGKKIKKTLEEISGQYSLLKQETVRIILKENEIDFIRARNGKGDTKGLRQWAEQRRGQKVEDTQGEMAEQYSVSLGTVNSILKEYGIESRRTTERVNQLRQWAEGKRGQKVKQTLRSLADKFQVSRQTVNNVVREYGIETKGGTRDDVKYADKEAVETKLRRRADQGQENNASALQELKADGGDRSLYQAAREFGVELPKFKKNDNVMMSKDVGGIDLNANETTLEEQGDKIELPVSANPSDWQNFQTNGFFPSLSTSRRPRACRPF